MFDIEYAGLTDVGCVREKNEDAWVAVPEMGLFIVSDGIGGNFETGGTDNITALLIDIGASKATETTQDMDTEA